jgi:hypothetical protein
MTERTPKFDPEDLADATTATAELPGAFSTPLPRGRALADVPPGAEVRYHIPGVPESSDNEELHYDVPANRSYASGNTADLPPLFSPERTITENVHLGLAFERFDRELACLAPRWMTNAPVSRITAMVEDLRAFMRIVVEDVDLAPVYTPSAEATMLVHDTYVRLISVAGILREAMEDRWANATDLGTAYAHAEATLDAFTPFVGLADRAMRRICLEGETLEAALRWLAQELDLEAAERLREAEAFVARTRESN